MRQLHSRYRLAFCGLFLLLALPQGVLSQGNVPAGVPPDWLTPIGGAATTNTPAAPATNTPTTGGTDPAATGAQIGAQPTTTTTPPAGTAVGTPTDPNAAATTTPPTDPNAGATGLIGTPTTPTTTTTTDPNAAVIGTPVTPTDPNAAATATSTPGATPPPTDPNAAAIGTPVTPIPTATTTTPPTDPNAAAIGGGLPTATNTTATPTTPTTTVPPLGTNTTTPPTATTTPPLTDPTASGNATIPGALVGAGNGTVGSPPPPTDASATPTDTQEEAVPSPIPDNLPPAPPADWMTLKPDTNIIFGLQLDGPYLVPWTKSKSWVFNNVLVDRYLRSVDIQDVETGPLQTKQYNVPAPPSDGSRRRRLHRRSLHQDSGAAGSTVSTSILLRVTVHTNQLRVESEVRSVVDGVSSGTMAQDLSMALGSPVTNITLTAQPITQPYDYLTDPNASTGGSLPGWIIGCIVGAVLVLMPIPIYILYKRHRRKHLEALEKQQAEAAAARQRMQSRVIKSGGKSFTAGRGGSEHDILARTGSIASYGGGVGMGVGPGIGPGSVIAGGQYGGGGGGGPDSMEGLRADSITAMHMQRQGSFVTPPPPRSPTRTLQQQLSLQRYQEQSLGPGCMPAQHNTPQRIPSYSSNMHMHERSMSIGRGVVVPVSRGSDEASTSSGNLSDRRPL